MKLLALILATIVPAAHASMPVCERTTAVKEFIETFVKKTCDQVTDADLLTIKRIAVSGKNITQFNADDFTGLTNLETLNIRSNPYTELPEGLLRDLVNLKTIVIIETNLRHLPDDFLAYSDKFEEVHVFWSPFRSISESVFKRLEKQKNLKQISLDEQLQDAEKDRMKTLFPEKGPVIIEWNNRT